MRKKKPKGIKLKILNKAFTLTELLIALTVVGTIAVLAIPGMLEGINEKINSAQLKSAVADIQHLMDDQLTHHKVISIENTDFKTSAGIFSDFETVKRCAKNDTEACWPEEVDISTNNTPVMAAYKILDDISKPSFAKPSYDSAILKNGVSVAYNVINELGTDACYGEFWVDINGKDKPNILGRDLFSFFVTKKGKIVDRFKCDELKEVEESSEPEEEPETSEEEEEYTSLEDKLTKTCKNGTVPSACLTLIQLNNWKIDY